MKESSRKAEAASPCAACKVLRRRCAEDCVFAPYFPADEPHKFASVHKVFGASNVNKMLQELPEHQRGECATSPHRTPPPPQTDRPEDLIATPTMTTPSALN